MNNLSSMRSLPTPILEMKAVSKQFRQATDMAARLVHVVKGTTPTVVHAVDNVDLAIQAGEVVGLVGESGCGKSTLGRMVVGLHSLSSGTRTWKGKPVWGKHPQDRTILPLQMIFQDPYASLNPRMRVQDIIGEAALAHGLVKAKDAQAYVAGLLSRVGLEPSLVRRFPHQFSGGQRARIGIARALAVKPEFIVCDEAVAALDVSIQAQVINLFMRLRQELNLTYLFISHDLGVVSHISDRIVIMYLGRVVESGPSQEIFSRPNHPYSQALLAEIPRLETRKRAFIPIAGEIPSPLHPPNGCHFHPRCPATMARCKTDVPVLREVAPARFSACHLNDQS
ncbi:MAG: ABC transporter ATP-binding protein [Burkholderiales bacterium]|nr:ABC transporter ATP-binding protein [Burkholderiales bacterium]